MPQEDHLMRSLTKTHRSQSNQTQQHIHTHVQVRMTAYRQFEKILLSCTDEQRSQRAAVRSKRLVKSSTVNINPRLKSNSRNNS